MASRTLRSRTLPQVLLALSLFWAAPAAAEVDIGIEEPDATPPDPGTCRTCPAPDAPPPDVEPVEPPSLEPMEAPRLPEAPRPDPPRLPPVEGRGADPDDMRDRAENNAADHAPGLVPGAEEYQPVPDPAAPAEDAPNEDEPKPEPIAQATEWSWPGFDRATIVTASAGAAALLAAFLAKVLWALYARHTEAQLLDHPVRLRILASLRAHPHASLEVLANGLHVRASRLRHHVWLLERGGLIRSQRVGRTRLYVAQDTVRLGGRAALTPPHDVLARADPAMAQVLQLLPPDGQRLNPLLVRLAAALGLSRPGALKAVARAQTAGLLRLERDGPRTWVRPV
jgi:DNA-binding transcriptional ArsR family regulator